MEKSSVKYLAKSTFDELLESTAIYNNCISYWGKIAFVINRFINEVLICESYTVNHVSKEGTKMYSYPLKELTPELTWEMILRDMSLYCKRDILVLTPKMKRQIAYFLNFPLYETEETCVRVANFISCHVIKSAKKAGLPKYNLIKKVVVVQDKPNPYYTKVSEFLTKNFPLSTKVLLWALSPERVMTNEINELTNSDFRIFAREVHPDKLVSEEIADNVKQVAKICIIILNQLKEDKQTKISYSLKDVYYLIL